MGVQRSGFAATPSGWAMPQTRSIDVPLSGAGNRLMQSRNRDVDTYRERSDCDDRTSMIGSMRRTLAQEPLVCQH